jgi:hypothetical protein
MTPPTDYPTLFDIHPLGTEPPIAQRPITPGCLLPIPENKVIDADRAAGILNVSRTTIWDLLDEKLLRGYQLGRSQPWNILYDSVVELCDDLRLRFHIADRRKRQQLVIAPPLARFQLAFPAEDTISLNEAAVGLGSQRKIVLHLIEEGKFDAYQLYERGSWRISKSSLFAFAAQKAEEVTQTPSGPRRRGRTNSTS